MTVMLHSISLAPYTSIHVHDNIISMLWLRWGKEGQHLLNIYGTVGQNAADTIRCLHQDRRLSEPRPSEDPIALDTAQSGLTRLRFQTFYSFCRNSGGLRRETITFLVIHLNNVNILKDCLLILLDWSTLSQDHTLQMYKQALHVCYCKGK